VQDVTIELVVALVFSRLDYFNAVLAGLPAIALAPLQRFLHTAARLANDLRPHDLIAQTFRELIGCREFNGPITNCACLPACPQVTDRPLTGLH